ncbi:MAG: TatD family hydrolase [Bacteroidia bacterium]
MILTDTHAHLYSDKYQSDRDDMIKRAVDAGVTRLFLPAIDRESHEKLDALSGAYPEHCFPMMGLHPTSVDKNTIDQELQEIESRLKSGKYCAVGEIGIDLYWDKSQADLQKEVFALQIDWAKQLGLPIAIHSRNAFYECYEIVKAKQDGTLKGIFHCFSDGIIEAELVAELGGFMMGLGGVLTFKNSGLDKVAEATDIKHFVLETDAPYLAPVPHRGQRNESAYIIHVAEKLASIKNMTTENVARITTANSVQLFGK